MGKCSAEQRLAFLIPQVHHGLRTQVRRVVEVSAARGWKWQRALQLLWGWQAAAMAGRSLLASCVPPGPPAWPAAAPEQSYQLQTTHGCALPQSNTRSSWLVAADSSQPFRPASVLLWFLPMQKASGASRFSSHSTWVLEGCMPPFTSVNNFGG